MKKEHITKLGYYDIHKIINEKSIKYEVDSGQYLFVKRFNKYIVNPYRDKKTFTTLTKAKEYIKTKLGDQKKKKKEIIDKLPKSLYLILMKEEETNKTFVKVGITSKKFLMRRFSKQYGYKGYTIESILRRIDTPDAEKLEEEIKEKLNKKRSVKKYRPILESFSGYSECYDILAKDEIITTFDSCVLKTNH